MWEKDYNYNYSINAKRFGFDFMVRKMRVDEMPEDGITYYCDVDGTIYQEGETDFLLI